MQETLSVLPQDITNCSSKSKDEDQPKEVELLVPPPCIVTTRARSQPNSRRVTPTATAPATTEKIFLNGDLYAGSLSGRVPHGTGKYVWCDGCMYEGEWKRGKPHGKGKFSWPSGATYEGDFKSRRMDGYGTFVGVEGDTYRGFWLSDRKHGFGEKRYANGDVYVGMWNCNLMEGHGRYVWSDGNEYDGEWKKGVISGKGVLTWANGNIYRGHWENGVPKGEGVFTRADGKSFPRSWEEMMARKRLSVDGALRSVNVPRICIWESDGEAGDITCDFVDNVEASVFCKDGRTRENYNSQLQRSPCSAGNGEVKKPGQTISKGHKNYDLMLNLQLGIRHSVGKHTSILRELRSTDFDPKEKFWTRFPPEGSKFTPPHQSVDFRWKDYCPMVFRHLRELFAIDPAEYMLAICGNDALRELSSPGKSGSLFYLTQDDRFMIKTVKKSEVKALIRMLPSYYHHVCQYKSSLITKFLGVHCVKPVGGQKTRFVVMGNVLSSAYRIHKRFDLKGSSYGRTIDKPEGEIDETTTLKDLDLNFVFHLERSWYQQLIRQIDRDCEFLEAERIMDYSLLIGLHFCDDLSGDETKILPQLGKKDVHHDGTSMRGYHLLPNMDWVMESRGPLKLLGANMPARAERVARIEVDQHIGSASSRSSTSRSGGETFHVVLYFGIIDILQDYDISKKLEHAYKSLQVDPTSISAVDPKLYSKRFRDFIHRIFVEDSK